jgi:hypothetical protein
MNPRIKELKEQAMEWVPNMADPDTKIRLLNAEKFAELIVEECLYIVEGEDDGSADTKSVRLAMIRMKQHFGVEE